MRSRSWQVTTFLSQINKLPPEVEAQWKTMAQIKNSEAK